MWGSLQKFAYSNGYAGYIDGTVAQVGGSSMANATGMKMTTVRVKAVILGRSPGTAPPALWWATTPATVRPP
ncbi:MAG: hypothetical protein V8R27_00310 [Oscillospiraceae bacterium]